jgi:hypothetical protein
VYSVIVPKYVLGNTRVTPEDVLDINQNFYVTAAWAYLFGFSCSLLFLWKSKETQERWMALLRKMNVCMSDKHDNASIGQSKAQPSPTARHTAEEVLAVENNTNTSTNDDDLRKDADFLNDDDYVLEFDTRGMDTHDVNGDDRDSYGVMHNPISSHRSSGSTSSASIAGLQMHQI